MENDLKSLTFKFYKRELESGTSIITSSFVMIALKSSASLENGTL